MARFILSSIVLAVFISSTFAAVPSYIHVCGRRNPNLDKCVLDSVSTLNKKLYEGIPELDVPSLDALAIGPVPLADLPEFRAIANNVILGGIPKYKVKHLKVDLDKQEIHIDVSFPEITLKSNYDIRARILVDITDKGPIDLVTYNIAAKILLTYKLVERKGRQHVYFNTMTLKLLISDYTAKFKPQSKDTPVTQAINKVLAESRSEIIESMTPALEVAISKKILEAANQMTKHFTYDEFFPDRV